jgi:hypothetical protein
MSLGEWLSVIIISVGVAATGIVLACISTTALSLVCAAFSNSSAA